MKPLRPILRDDPNERVRALLSSAQLDVPPSGWTQRVLLAAACLPPMADVTEFSVDDGAGASVAAPAISSGVAKSIAIKWAAIGAIAGGVLSATIMHAVDKRSESDSVPAARAHRDNTASEHRVPSTPQPASSAHSIALDPIVGNVKKPAVEPETTKTEQPLQVGSSATRSALIDRRSPAVNLAKQKPEPQPVDVTDDLPQQTAPTTLSLADEVRSLNRIRQLSLDQGAVVALQELDHHDRQYPMPNLGIESAVLRIDLLWSAGRNSAARAQSEQFLLAHPDCPHAKHVRTLLRQHAAGQTRARPSSVEDTKP